MSRRTRYIVEPRDPSTGRLLTGTAASGRWMRAPYLLSKTYFTIDELAHWVSFGEGRSKPCGPTETFAFLRELGLPAREVTW